LEEVRRRVTFAYESPRPKELERRFVSPIPCFSRYLIEAGGKLGAANVLKRK